MTLNERLRPKMHREYRRETVDESVRFYGRQWRFNMAIFSSRIHLAVVIVLLAAVLVGVSPAAEFERPPTLPAQVLAPVSLLSGSGFHVNNEVPTDGLLAHYTIQSDVGVFQADSTEMLKIRIAEIPAIQELTKTSKTKVFAQS
jgi:hypothetical protein